MSRSDDHWRMTEQCNDCPFRLDGKGIPVTDERLEEIKYAQALGQPFFCHKTVDYSQEDYDDDGNDLPYRPTGEELECAGALAYRETPECRESVGPAWARLLLEVEQEQRRKRGARGQE